MSTPEGAIKNAICAWLSYQPGIKVWVNDSVGIFDPVRKIYRKSFSPYKIKGVADILGIMEPTGRFLAIEVKVKGKYPSPEQRQFLEMINRMGGLGFVARSVEDVAKALIQPKTK